jgi:hypothetical protein
MIWGLTHHRQGSSCDMLLGGAELPACAAVEPACIAPCVWALLSYGLSWCDQECLV